MFDSVTGSRPRQQQTDTPIGSHTQGDSCATLGSHRRLLALTRRMGTFKPDRRGDHLDDWDWEHVGQERLLLLRGSAETAEHILEAFPNSVKVDLYPRHRPRWTHRLRLRSAAGINELIELLQRVLILPALEDLDGTIALDHYSCPAPMTDTGLRQTVVGERIHTIKYENRDPSKVQAAGRELSRQLAEVVRIHPWFRTSDLILPVPGHDSMHLSASIRIGTTVARYAEIGWASVTSVREFRRTAKSMSKAERVELLDEYSVDLDLTGRTVIVLDDVCHTGSSLRGVARAARNAGATTVLGLVGARTLRT